MTTRKATVTRLERAESRKARSGLVEDQLPRRGVPRGKKVLRVGRGTVGKHLLGRQGTGDVGTHRSFSVSVQGVIPFHSALTHHC